jgi:hypothetical protein
MDELLNVVDTISNLGALGVLIIVAWAFYRGKVISREISDKRVEDAKEVAGLLTSDSMKSAIKQSVKEGFIDAWYELRNMGQKMFVCPYDDGESEIRIKPRKKRN